MSIRRLIALSAVGLVVAGCGSGGGGYPTDGDGVGASESASAAVGYQPAEPRGGTSDPGATTDSSDAPLSDPTAVPPFPEDTEPQSAQSSGEPDLVLDGVRVGKRDGYERIVLVFAGTGTPGWQVNYVKEAVLDGSGEVVALGGDATLDVYASGTTYDPDKPYGGLGHVELSKGGGAVEDVYVVGTFEGNTQVLVGTDARVPFRVFTLSHPARLVVDVADRR